MSKIKIGYSLLIIMILVIILSYFTINPIGGKNREGDAHSLISDMTLDEKIGQMLVAGVNGTQMDLSLIHI